MHASGLINRTVLLRTGKFAVKEVSCKRKPHYEPSFKTSAITKADSELLILGNPENTVFGTRLSGNIF